MWLGRLKRSLAELDRECERAAEDEERANFELARSARSFSQRARESADDKLAFSAVLVRAGEVGAAERLIHDLERDVRAEEVALSDRVMQVKEATATKRAKMTRLRLARTLTAAVLAAGLLSFSAAGMALTSFLAGLGDDPGVGPSNGSRSLMARSEDPSAGGGELRSFRLPDGTKVALTRGQLRAVRNLAANPHLDRAELERLLIDLVGPKIAGRLAKALAALTQEATQAAGDIERRAGEATSNLDGLESPSSHTGSGPPSNAPTPGEHQPVEHPDESPAKPAGDGGVIDTPLGVEPQLPGSDLGGD